MRVRTKAEYRKKQHINGFPVRGERLEKQMRRDMLAAVRKTADWGKMPAETPRGRIPLRTLREAFYV